MPACPDRHWQQIAVDDLAAILGHGGKRETGRDRNIHKPWEKSLQVGEEKECEVRLVRSKANGGLYRSMSP